jgi:branched-chain amino acid transport system substrate-binding protein
MQPRAFSLLACVLMLAGCGTSNYAYQPGAPTARLPMPAGAVAGAASGQKVAILLPMTGQRADIGQVLSQAASLALPGGLDVLDTAGTPAGASAAAQSAVAHGDQMILGPLT